MELIQKKLFFPDPLQKIDDGIFLPILWLEITVGEMSDDLKSTIFHSTFSANVAHIILKYGTLLMLMVAILLISITILKLSRMRMDKGVHEPSAPPAEMEQLNKPDISHC